MVCVPCVAVPILLIIWKFFIQPLILKWWQWRSNGENKTEPQAAPDLVKECNNGVCTLRWKKKDDDIKND